jgi:hypothetical protein
MEAGDTERIGVPAGSSRLNIPFMMNTAIWPRVTD